MVFGSEEAIIALLMQLHPSLPSSLGIPHITQYRSTVRRLPLLALAGVHGTIHPATGSALEKQLAPKRK